MADLNDLNRPLTTDTEPNVLDTLRAHVARAATWTWSTTAGKVAGLMSAATTAVSGGRSMRLYRRNDANTADEEIVSLPGVSVGGNAATVTNGVYTTGDQTIGGVKTFSNGIGLVSSPHNWELATPVEINKTAAFCGFTANAVLASNCYYSTDGWRYSSTCPVARFESSEGGSGNSCWFSAPSGAAGSVVPALKRMALAQTGELWVGSSITAGGGFFGSGAGLTNIPASALSTSANSTWGLFRKLDPYTPAFVKTGANTVSIKAGTFVEASGAVIQFNVQTAVTMPSLAQGTDYSIWCSPDGALQAVADPFNAPAVAPVAGARKIGGFHVGLIGAGTTIAGGGFATTGSGMIWTQADVDRIASINEFSLWDIKFTVGSMTGQPRGMALDPQTRTWVGLYLVGSNHIANGASRFNTDVASGAVLPRRPLVYGGNGTSTYTNGNWWAFNEVLASHGLRFGTEAEFVSAAFGVTENQSLGGAASTIPATIRAAGYTSRIGCEQMTGHHWIWGADTGHYGESFSWQNVNDGRGQVYTSANTKVLLGGARSYAAFSGSLASAWGHAPWPSSWYVGARAFGDLLVLL